MKRGSNFIVALMMILFTATHAVSEEKTKAPNFSLKTFDGKVIELASLKGKVVIINFWATWCPPCRAEIPDFIKVYEQYKSKGLVIIGIALDEDGWTKVKPFVSENKMTYPIVLGTPEVVQRYGGISGIPTTFAVDTNGYIAAMQVGMLSGDALESEVKSLLAAPRPPEQKKSLLPPSTSSQVTVDAKLSSDKIPVGKSVRIALQLHIAEGWHVNSHTPTYDYLIGTAFEMTPKEGFIVSDLQYPPGHKVSLSFAEQPIDVYEGVATIFATVKTSGMLKPGADTLRGRVTVQACNNQICLAPSTIDVAVPVQLAAADAALQSMNTDLFAGYTPSEQTAVKPRNDFAAMFDEKGSLLTFLAIFLVGLALNLTPCVYPMLTVTVSLFGGHSETRPLRVFFRALVYVVGIATMYSILGVTAALGGGLFGSWLQSPWVLGGISALLFLLALSSFGVYQLRMPYWLTSKLGGTTGTGMAAVYLSGLVVGVFAAPCVGAPVIALMAFVAGKGSAVFGFWTFFILSLGLGLPYLILGTFSGLLKKIPRSGSWLVWVEHLFGVVLAGAGLFYLFLAVAPKDVIYVVPAAFVIGGIYLGFVDSAFREKRTLKIFQRVFGVAAVVVGVLLAGGLREKGMVWETYSDTALLEAKENGMPVVLDFYADWCIPCLELDQNTWTNEEVVGATTDMKRMKVDLTHFDSRESETVRKKFNISGVPTVILLRGDGTEPMDSRIVGYIPPSEFLKKLKQAMLTGS